MGLQPFRFLHIPWDLRIIFYKRLPIVTNHFTLPNPVTGQDTSTMALVTHGLAVSILATCPPVYNEAMSCLAPQLAKLRELRRVRTTRLILDDSHSQFSAAPQPITRTENSA